MSGPGDGWFEDNLRAALAPRATGTVADATNVVPSYLRQTASQGIGDYLHAGREAAAGAAETLAPIVAQQAFPFVNPNAVAALVQRLKVGDLVGGQPTPTDSALREAGSTATNGVMLASAVPSLVGLASKGPSAVAALARLLAR